MQGQQQVQAVTAPHCSCTSMCPGALGHFAAPSCTYLPKCVGEH